MVEDYLSGIVRHIHAGRGIGWGTKVIDELRSKKPCIMAKCWLAHYYTCRECGIDFKKTPGRIFQRDRLRILNWRDERTGQNLLHRVAANKDKWASDVATYLLRDETHISIISQDSQGQTPMHIAARDNDTIHVLCALMNDCKSPTTGKYPRYVIDALDKFGTTPLHVALTYHQQYTAKMLVFEAEADITKPTNKDLWLNFVLDPSLGLAPDIRAPDVLGSYPDICNFLQLCQEDHWERMAA